jgi:hypothetical protein
MLLMILPLLPSIPIFNAKMGSLSKKTKGLEAEFAVMLPSQVDGAFSQREWGRGPCLLLPLQMARIRSCAGNTSARFLNVPDRMPPHLPRRVAEQGVAQRTPGGSQAGLSRTSVA